MTMRDPDVADVQLRPVPTKLMDTSQFTSSDDLPIVEVGLARSVGCSMGSQILRVLYPPASSNDHKRNV